MMKVGTRKSGTVWNVLFGARKILLVMLFVVVGLFTIFHTAFAGVGDSTGPNPTWFGNTDTVRYVLEYDENVNNAQSVSIPIYVLNGNPAAPPTVTLTADNLSGGYSSESPACLSVGGGCTCRLACSVTLAPARFTYSTVLGGWTTEISAYLLDGYNGRGSNILEFQLSASANAIIGYDHLNGNSFAVAHTYTTGRYYDYSIPFGTDCSVQSAQATSLTIYDGDVGNSGIQPVSSSRPFVVELVDTTTNTVVFSHSYATLAQANAADLGNNESANYGFTAEPNHKYVFEIDNVYSHNTLQFRLPYNSIFSQITCGFDLQPSISVTPSIAEGGSDVTVTPTVDNVGSVVSSNAQWQISTMVYRAGVTPPAAGTENAETPCAYFNTTNDGGTCAIVNTGTGTYSAGSPALFTSSGGSAWGPEDAILSDAYPAGTQICYALSVTPITESDTNWADSAPKCVTIGKKPKVNITGGDVIVGRSFSGTSPEISKIDTSTTVKTVGGTQTTYGSWVEYAAFATGPITGLGSGAAFAGGLQNSTGVCDYSALTFTNAGSTASCADNAAANGTLGSYTSTQSIPNVAASYPVPTNPGNNLGSSPTINLANVSSGTYTATGTITFVGATVPKGVSFILNAPQATVDIKGNIDYFTGTLNSLSDIPQVVIIAKNIIINDSAASGVVTEVDSWLIATNSINTCDLPGNDAAPLTVSTCTDPLIVNGPVMTNLLYLNRTAGSGPGTQSGDPAETFNLRPDAYLWAYAQSLEGTKIQSVYLSELPPRF